MFGGLGYLKSQPNHSWPMACVEPTFVENSRIAANRMPALDSTHDSAKVALSKAP